ncbi:hypothetical protein FRC12_022081 [Ceratobasidium sp. 428]|nr:hypothetical protein FRC12_022081 [Ceratobasidium sp. 428]
MKPEIRAPKKTDVAATSKVLCVYTPTYEKLRHDNFNRSWNTAPSSEAEQVVLTLSAVICDPDEPDMEGRLFESRNGHHARGEACPCYVHTTHQGHIETMTPVISKAAILYRVSRQTLNYTSLVQQMGAKANLALHYITAIEVPWSILIRKRIAHHPLHAAACLVYDEAFGGVAWSIQSGDRMLPPGSARSLHHLKFGFAPDAELTRTPHRCQAMPKPSSAPLDTELVLVRYSVEYTYIKAILDMNTARRERVRCDPDLR